MTTLHRTPRSPDNLPPSLLPLWKRACRMRPAPYLACTEGALDGLVRISNQVLVEGSLVSDDTWRERVRLA